MSAMNIRMFAAFIDTLNWRYNLKTKQRALKFPWDSYDFSLSFNYRKIIYQFNRENAQ